MTIEEAGPDPALQAAAIHTQLPASQGAIPLTEIAAALDIIEIKIKNTKGFVGALVMTVDRNVGSIVVDVQSSQQRRRFTIAHELGHFLNLSHKPIVGGGFTCGSADIALGWTMPSASASRHQIQEAQANRFAIELLAPASRVRPHLRAIADLEDVLKLAKVLDLSKEAAARRYAELHPKPTALVLTKDGLVRYIDRKSPFPFIDLKLGDRVPSQPERVDESGLSNHEEADPSDWLVSPNGNSLVVQTLHQQNGYAMTLLVSEDAGGKSDE